ARFGSYSRNIAVTPRRSQTKRRVKARGSSLRAVVTELYPKSQTAFCHQEKTRSSGSCPAALAATSEEHSRFPREPATLPKYFAPAGPCGSTLVEFHTSITTELTRRDISWASLHAA